MITDCKTKTARHTRRGFTLVEVLLAGSLFMLFVGAAIICLTPASRGSELDQGAVRLESILRFARAEAANSGRRVRVSFVPEAARTTNQPNQVRLTWEPAPLDEPEVFQDLSRTQWGVESLNESVNVEQVRLIDSNAVADESNNQGAPEDKTEMAVPAEALPITFNPDGSSDSAEIVLAARNAEDSRRIMVRITGLTGAISRAVAAHCDGEATPGDRGTAPEAPPLMAE